MKKILKFASTLLGCCVSAMAIAQTSLPSEYYVAYLNVDGGTPPPTGIYRLSNAPKFKTSEVTLSSLRYITASTYANSTYYIVNNSQSAYTLATVDLTSGKVTTIGNLDAAITSVSYNPLKNNILGYSQTQRTFYDIDLTNGKATELVRPNVIFNTITVDNSGQVYGISNTEALYTVNLTNATTTLVGYTVETTDPTPGGGDLGGGDFGGGSSGSGSTVDKHLICDRASDRLLVALQPFGANTYIYEVSKSNGKMTEIGNCNTGQHLLSFFTRTESKADASKVPGQPTQIGVVFTTPGSKSATLSAVAPTKAQNQTSTISGSVILTFFVDEIEVGKTTVNAGAKGSINYTFAEEGEHRVKVQTSNSNGDGLSDQAVIYVGFDVPSAVTDAKLTIDANGKVNVTWKAPTTGAQNGTIEASKLTYDVVCYPTKRAVSAAQKGTSFTESVNPTYLYNYAYGITPVIGDKRGEEVMTNAVAFGKGLRLPFVEQFTNEDYWPLYTVLDENNDGSWVLNDYRGGVARVPAGKNQSSDWLVTPCINMRAGLTYTIDYVASAGFNQAGVIKVYALDKPEIPWGGASALNALSSLDLDSNNELSNSFTYTPTEDKQAYFAFFTNSNPGVTTNLHSYVINVTSAADAPAEVDNLSIEAGANGELYTTIKFNAPTLRADGTQLATGELTAIEIYTENSKTPIHAISNPTPGKEYTYTHTNPYHNKNTYLVRCFSDNGVSEGVGKTLWVGEDYPTRPLNVKASLSDDGDKILVTWDRPEAGYYGGYVDFDNLTYNVQFFASNSSLEDYITLLTGVTDCKAEFRIADLRQFARGDRVGFSFAINAVSSAGAGPGAAAGVVIGDAYSLPFSESFAGGVTTTSPWTVTTIAGSGSNWMATTGAPSTSLLAGLSAQDNDGGMAMFYDRYAQSGIAEARLLGPKIDISGSVDPVITFYVYHRTAPDTDNNWLMIEGQASSGEYTPLSEKIAVDGFGWTKHEIHLKDMAPANMNLFRLVFHGRAAGTNDFYVDNVTITDGKVGSQYPRVTDLTAQLSTDETKVTLTWSEPEHEGFNLIGYYIYRDGRKVSNNYTTDTTYETTYPTDGKTHTYAVQAIYNEGDALLSNEVLVVSSSLEGVEGAQAKIYTEGSTLVIEAENTAYIVVNVSGLTVAAGTADGRATIDLTTGIYIVKAGSESAKIAVR